MKRILLTGGHAGTTALAVIEELVAREKGWDVYWVGPKKALEGKKVTTLEAKHFPQLGVTFHPIIAGRLQAKWTIHTIPSLARIPFGFIHAFLLLAKIKPQIIISFGGFAAFPVVVAGFLRRIKIIIHEQTTAAGLANRLSTPFASKICLARKQSKKYFPPEKTVVVGNPVMKSILNVLPKKKLGQPPVLFITCGSRGSQIINQTIRKTLPNLLARFTVVHQTGDLDYGEFKKRETDNYEVYNFIEPDLMADFYRRADIVIARSGANTVSEIMVTKRPSVLIPIPWTRGDEQTKNAQLAQAAGVAKVIHQEALTEKSLLTAINEAEKNWRRMVNQSTSNLARKDACAAAKLVDLIE